MNGKLCSEKDLIALREAVVRQRDPNKTCVTICGETGCLAWGGEELRSAFIEEIESIRRCGFSESRGRMTAGANTIGMIAPSTDQKPLLAIGIGGPSERIEQKRLQIIAAMRRRLGGN